jgi:enolase
MKITRIHGRMILDSRGRPTVEAEVTVDGGAVGRAAVPSGASTGKYEAVERRDGGQAWQGLGVSGAVEAVNGEIAVALVGQDCRHQSALDAALQQLDGTPNKGRLGANAILAVSLACAKAAAEAANQPLYRYIAKLAGQKAVSLPRPMVNVLNGGQHAVGSTDVQEIMIVPVGATSVHQAVQMSAEVFYALGGILRKHSLSTTVGDEGGYAPSFKGSLPEALDVLLASIKAAGYEAGREVAVALDVAASELVREGVYVVDGETRTAEQMVAWYGQLIEQYPIISIEDGLGEDDWSGWVQLQQKLGDAVQLVGDDLFVTNTKLLQKGITEQCANAILIKPNQIGTLTETIAAVQMAQAAGWRTIISHRSGETSDTTIAHLAVGLNAGQIKCGSMSRTERMAKYNELLRIEEQEPGLTLRGPAKLLQ